MNATLNRSLAAISAALMLTLAGCDKGEQRPDPATSPGAHADPAESTVALPASVWLDARPERAKPLTEVKASAKAGDRVAFLAQVGGRERLYVPGRAIVLVADPALHDCSEGEEPDHCTTPWDYCCEDPAKLKAGTAAIQFVDASGAPLHVSLEGMDQFKPLTTFYITGVVHERDDQGTFTVNADGVFIDRSPAPAEG